MLTKIQKSLKIRRKFQKTGSWDADNSRQALPEIGKISEKNFKISNFVQIRVKSVPKPT